MNEDNVSAFRHEDGYILEDIYRNEYRGNIRRVEILIYEYMTLRITVLSIQEKFLLMRNDARFVPICVHIEESSSIYW